MKQKIDAFLLGGTGFLGTGIQKFSGQNWKTLAFSSKQYNSTSFRDAARLVDLIRKENPRYVIDFTRNSRNDIASFMYLIQMIPKECTYVNISSYGVEHDDVYLGQEDYNQTKRKIENMVRHQDYSIRLPLIVPDSGLTKQLVDDVYGNHVWICTLTSMCQFLWKVLHLNKPGLYTCPGEYVDLDQWKKRNFDE